MKSKKKEIVLTREYLSNAVDEEIKGILRNNLYESALKKSDAKILLERKRLLRKNLRLCGTGCQEAKRYVKLVIQDILLERFHINRDMMEQIIPFHRQERLNTMDQFYLMLMMYQKKYENKAFEVLAQKWGWAAEDTAFQIKGEDIQKSFQKEKIQLSFLEQIAYLTQKIYELTYGLGVVDELCFQKIDGISGGTSSGKYRENSVWIQWRGRNIHLEFLEFGEQDELMRVCRRIYRFGEAGQLSASRGYIVNQLADQSRVVVTRPPFSESWSFFVRRFDTVENKALSFLIQDENAALPIEFLSWIVKACTTMGITGAQGSGKTTLLLALVEYICPSYTLRVQEMNYELHLRERYPERNIVSFQETDSISAQEGLNLQKKTDGMVNILGEVADQESGSYLIQMGMVASLFTMFTHHAVTAEALVMALRNNLLAVGQFQKERTAEEQVVYVLRFDVHMNKNQTGHRYIERITEIIPEKRPAEEIQEKSFYCQDIIRFENGKYVFRNKLSERQLKHMKEKLKKRDWEEWNEWYQTAAGTVSEC